MCPGWVTDTDKKRNWKRVFFLGGGGFKKKKAQKQNDIRKEIKEDIRKGKGGEEIRKEKRSEKGQKRVILVGLTNCIQFIHYICR